ncbi:ArsR/SmtB family transcription factor [Streptomyces sp. NPDC127106]|uniref:ArsR/SmtB family transcription factor n=1 Tax=Streptomyces sp. NPDC127106 TaxID=3345360 RepID=UPI003642016A
MDLEARVSELERRLAALEAREAQQTQGAGQSEPADPAGDFWALEGFKARIAELGDDDGGVLFTGAVGLPTGERYEWQQGFPTGELLGEPAEDRQRTADALAALGSPVRIRLLREILAGQRTAAELTALDGVGTSGQIYHHLRQLTAAGWLHTTGRGRYEVPGGRVVPLLVVFAAATP